MSRLKPWIDDGAPQAASRLIIAARRERPSKDSLCRSLAAVGAGALAASTAAATGPTLGTAGIAPVASAKASMFAGGTSAIKWMLVGMGLGAAVVAGIEQSREPSRAALGTVKPTERVARSITPSRLARSRAARPFVAPEPSRADPVSAPDPEPSSTSVTSPTPKANASLSAPPAKRPTGSPEATGSERLAEEVRTIDEARSALTSGRLAQTLTVLADYDRRYPEPRFAPEALYLRMEALLQSSRNAQARETAEQLVAAYPQSPQSARARLVLARTIP
jgi:TolA-binding protein